MGRGARRGDGEGPRLFGPEEMLLRPTGTARLRALARKRSRRPTATEAQSDEDREMTGRLRVWGRELARRFKLDCRSIDPERSGVHEHYGICYEDGAIRIRLRHAKTGRLLKESSLVDTLCHELAHLRHLDHSPRFRRLYIRILETARELGYYRPGPQGDARPKQLSLFDPRACGTRREGPAFSSEG
jgi:hypothetical protein